MEGNSCRLSYCRLASWSERLAEGLRIQASDDDAAVAALMHRGCALYAFYLAAARCGLPLVPLSLDHRDRLAEDLRWTRALEAVGFRLVVFDDAGAERWPQLPHPPGPQGAVSALHHKDLEAALEGGGARPWRRTVPARVLALVFTGGTTRAARCVEVTHAMAVHETRCYREAVPLRAFGECILQLSSAYWGAALLGELDVALSCGGAAIFAEAATPEEVWAAVCRHGVTVLGIVPALLAHLPLDQVRCSKLHTVIAWADVCPALLAQRWRAAGVNLVELLIATEYWLSFYAGMPTESGDRARYFPVDSVHWRVASDKADALGGLALEAEVGELWLAGPMVSPGYRGADAQEFRTVECDGRHYFRTGDLVRRLRGGGLEFLGRHDMMAKAAGRWVDLRALEDTLRTTKGVIDAAVLAHPSLGPRPQAFVSVSTTGCSGAGEQTSALSAAAACTRELQAAVAKSGTIAGLHLVAEQTGGLPRHLVTRKVDTRCLAALVALAAGAPSRWYAAQSARCWLQRFMLSGVVTVVLAWRWPAIAVPRLVSAPFLWLSVMLLGDWKLGPLELPRHRLLVFFLAMALPRRWLPLPMAPGLVWALCTQRAFSWALVFWVSSWSHAPMAITTMVAAMHARACKTSRTFRRLRRSRVSLQFQSARDFIVQAGAMLNNIQRDPASAALFARYTYAADCFDGYMWYDSSGQGRHAKVVRGSPRLELSGALAFTKDDAMLMLGVPMPPRFTIIATARYQPARLRVTFTEFKDGLISSSMSSERGQHSFLFRIRDPQGDGPVLVADTNGLSGMWQVMAVDGRPAPPLGQWHHLVSAGMELLLQEELGEQMILGSDDFVAGWLGGHVGAGWWSGGWHAWSGRLAGSDFHVVSLRNGDGVVGFVDGQVVQACEGQSGAANLQYHVRLGINTSSRKVTHGHSALLELHVFQGHVPDADVVKLSCAMAERAAAASAGVLVPEQEDHALVAAACSHISDDAECSQQWEPSAYSGVVVDDVDVAFTQPATRGRYVQIAASTSLCSRRLKIVLERVLGQPLADDDPLAGADSLRLMGLASALRREFGISVGTLALLQASTKGSSLLELEQLVEAVAAGVPDGQEGPQTVQSGPYTLWTAEGLYDIPLCWTLEAPEAINVAALEVALQQLCLRHIPLRAQCERPVALFKEVMSWTTDVASAAEVLCCWYGQQGKFARTLAKTCSWTLRHCWPRFHTCSNTFVIAPPLWECNAQDHDALKRAIAHSRDNFTPPCSFTLIHCLAPRADFLHMSVSHSLCDASSFGPLRSDLLDLYAAACNGRPVRLPPVPNAMCLLQCRLEEALSFAWGDVGDAGQAAYLGGWGSAPRGRRSWGHRRLIHVRSGAGAALHCASAFLNVPLDVLLVVALACSVARCDRLPVVRLTLTAPMRDGPNEGMLVGLFTDWRDLDIHTHPLQALASVALQTAEIVRGRHWSRGRVAQTSQRILVNLVAAEEATKDGFFHRAEWGCMKPPSKSGRAHCVVERPLEVQGWQLGPVEWTLHLKLHDGRYPPPWAARFAATLQQVVKQLAEEPFSPVHTGVGLLGESSAQPSAATPPR